MSSQELDAVDLGAHNGVSPTPTALLVTAREAARILGVGRTTLYALMNKGQLRPVHIGRSLRIPLAELERFVNSLRSGDVTSL
jgi:excisionase family DNA binding protein